MKKLVYILMMCCPILAWAQPVNDDCSGLIHVGEIPYCSNPGQYTNVDATMSNIDPTNNIPTCFNNNAERDVWFAFSLPADGTIVDISIAVFGNVGGNGTLQMPEVALYRGDQCAFGEVQELACAAAPVNVNEVSMDVFGLSPGEIYYLRINDYSATAAPNWGTFRFCVAKYIPNINMGTSPGTMSCTGTLFDSGGETGDYQPGEDLTFYICPQEFHQCIKINLEDYNVESGFDYLRFFEGNGISGTQITQITGTGSNFEVQVSTPCATIQFQSDLFAQESGFKITWECSPDGCTQPPPTSCAEPVVVTLPFAQNNLSNCFSGNSINFGPCDDDFLSGNDYVFSYESPGDECVHIAVSGSNIGSGVGVYDMCPNLPGANCISSAGGGIFDPVINAAFLQNAGTYYFVFGSGDDCTPFNISVDTITCPILLPPASTCDDALSLTGCTNNPDLPEIIALNPGAGDPNFIQDGVNQGCFVFPQFNYSFFYFTAGADGNFGFIVQSADPNEASDIDINVWGPIDDVSDICDYVSVTQPVRSTWSAGADPTGLADIHPVLGTAVTDEFDCGDPSTPGAGGDDFVSTLPVQQGKIYVVMMDDFGGAINNGGIAINFGPSTDGIFDGSAASFAVSPADTAVCPGQPVQLNANGGAFYQWTPADEVSCSNCPNPIVNPLQTSIYQVQIVTACQNIVKNVKVKVLEVELGPDVTVCNGAAFELNPNPQTGVQYQWTGSNLSCTDCPTPTVSGLPVGDHMYIATLITPNCTRVDTMVIHVEPGTAAQYDIADNVTICAGTSVALGGPDYPGVSYNWISSPSGFTSDQSNPIVTPTETTTYYLTATAGTCPYPSLDSIAVTVFNDPVLAVGADLAICQGDTIALATTVPQANTTYTWSPATGLIDLPTVASPLAAPTVTTTYTLTAANPGCSVTESITVGVNQISLVVNEDSLRICQGTAVDLNAVVNPSNLVVSWSPSEWLQVSSTGLYATATPQETITYTASVSVPGCEKNWKVYIAVDSLPDSLNIVPFDKTICQGELVTLVSSIYEPADYPNIQFEWQPLNGSLTPDSLYNYVVQPGDTITYFRTTTNGVCQQVDSATINVIPVASMSISPSNPVICPGESVQLTLTISPGVTGIEWTPADGLSCTDCLDPIATPTASTAYMINGMVSGCPVSTGVTVNINPLPQYQFPSDVQLCAGESVLLNSINDPSAVYGWTSTDPNFNQFSNPMPQITPTASGTYYLSVNNGCAVLDTLQITVAPSEQVSVSNNVTICQGQSTQLTASAAGTGTFSWSDGQTGPTISVAPNASTSYTVTYTYGDGCTSSATVFVSVQGQLPNIEFPTDVALCPGESATLNANPTPGATYTWTSNPAGFTSMDPTPVVSPAVPTTYTVTAAVGACSVTSSVFIIPYTATLTVNPLDTILCMGSSLVLSATGTGANGSFLWSTGDTQSTTQILTPSDTTVYSVVYTYGDGCTLTESVEVSVVPGIDVGIAVDPDTLKIGLGTELNLSAVVAPAQSLNGFTFEWLENQLLNLGTDKMITVQPAPSGTDSLVTYTLTVTSQYGCVDQSTVTILVVKPVVVFPNAFTPGNGGKNDLFGMVLLQGAATVESLQIYNRWGNLVYESTDPAATWDGKDGDKEAVSDVYVYVVRWRSGDDALHINKGEILLLR